MTNKNITGSFFRTRLLLNTSRPVSVLMSRTIKLAATFLLVVLFSLVARSQDSSVTVYNWKVESKKIAGGKYELTFTTPASGDWYIYAPNQVLLDVKTTELNFSDSAIVQEGEFIFAKTKNKEEASFIFENTKV